MEAKLLKRSNLADARGWLCEGVRESVEGHIAQVYVTTCYPGVVKGWHRHALQTDRMMCVSGMARIVVGLDDLGIVGSHAPRGWLWVKERVIGPLADEKVIVIPPGLWHAFTPCGGESCVIVNCPDREYDGTDEEHIPLEQIPYGWKEISR